MNVILLEEAQRQFEAEDAWWREHRDAKELFFDEFQDTLRQLSGSPGAGQRYRRARGKLIQRWMMKKTRCHLYYFHDKEREVLEIHSLWGARRRRGPQL